MKRAYVLVLGLVVLASANVAAADGGLRAVGRVRPADPGPALAVAAGTGYGFTEGVLDDDDGHHRVLGTLALAGRTRPWLELDAQVTGRYDKHTGATPDDGWIGDPRLSAQAGGLVGRELWLVGRAGLWLPGRNAPSVELDAATIDVGAALTWARGATALTATAGYRIDRSAASADPSVLSDPDRLALGLSQFDAVLVGAGVVHRRGGWEVLGEATWDVLVGAGAPDPLESPLRIGAGARREVGAAVRLEALLEVSPGPRAGAMAGDPLVAIEPRVSALVGVSWRPAPARPRAPLGGGAIDPARDAAPLPPARPAPTVGAVRGRIATIDGTPVAGATVRLGTRAATTDGDGRFVLDGVAAGTLDVTIDAPGHEPARRTIAVTAGGEAALEVTLIPVAPPAQLRGVVRSFDGKGLGATIKIVATGGSAPRPTGEAGRAPTPGWPGDLELTAAADGTFAVDVAPGTYQVTVSVAGFQPQTRKVTVEDQGVVVMNVELRRKR